MDMLNELAILVLLMPCAVLIMQFRSFNLTHLFFNIFCIFFCGAYFNSPLSKNFMLGAIASPWKHMLRGTKKPFFHQRKFAAFSLQQYNANTFFFLYWSFRNLIECCYDSVNTTQSFLIPNSYRHLLVLVPGVDMFHNNTFIIKVQSHSLWGSRDWYPGFYSFLFMLCL